MEPSEKPVKPNLKPEPINMRLNPKTGHGIDDYPAKNLPCGLMDNWERKCPEAKAGTWWTNLSPDEKRAEWLKCRYERRRRHDWSLAKGAALGMPSNDTVEMLYPPKDTPDQDTPDQAYWPRGALMLQGIVSAAGPGDVTPPDTLTDQLIEREQRLAAYAVALQGAPSWMDAKLFDRWVKGEAPASIAIDPELPSDKTIKKHLDAAMARIEANAAWQPLAIVAEAVEAKPTPLMRAERDSRASLAVAEYQARRQTARTEIAAIRNLKHPINRDYPEGFHARAGEPRALDAKLDAITKAWEKAELSRRAALPQNANHLHPYSVEKVT